MQRFSKVSIAAGIRGFDLLAPRRATFLDCTNDLSHELMTMFRFQVLSVRTACPTIAETAASAAEMREMNGLVNDGKLSNQVLLSSVNGVLDPHRNHSRSLNHTPVAEHWKS
jgi:hypothetical protein